MSVFFVNFQDGRVATRKQLVGAGLADAEGVPTRPWYPVSGPSDATTLWYAVLRRRERGVFIGMLCFRHSERHASLLAAGWEEVPVEEIRAGEPRDGTTA